MSAKKPAPFCKSVRNGFMGPLVERWSYAEAAKASGMTLAQLYRAGSRGRFKVYVHGFKVDRFSFEKFMRGRAA